MNEDKMMYVPSDKYACNPKKMEEMGRMFGETVVPVDSFGSFVPQNKDNQNLKVAQKNIQDRFQLSQSEVGKDPYGDEK